VRILLLVVGIAKQSVGCRSTTRTGIPDKFVNFAGFRFRCYMHYALKYTCNIYLVVGIHATALGVCSINK